MNPRIRVAAYNIHTCIGADGEKSAERVAGIIEELDADLVGLQEVESVPGARSESMQMDYLAEVTGYRPIPGPTILSTGRHYGNVVLARLPVGAVRRIDLSVTPYEPRGAIDLDIEAHGSTLRLINTHLGLRRRERWIQTDQLLRALGTAGARPTVLVGDFNDWWPWSAVGRALMRRFTQRRSPPTFPSRLPLFSLDRVYAGGGLRIREIQILRHRRARLASDHLPVVAELEWQNGAQRPGSNGRCSDIAAPRR